MPPKRRDVTGQRFGRLVAVSYAGNYAWNCLCDCGKKEPVVVLLGNLRSGDTKSCGCLNLEALSKRKTTHGMTGTKAYQAWNHMHQRCENPNGARYRSYGGRGIKVCERWDSFENFYEDMGDPPTEEHSLDRKDNDGDYTPGNCRWATRVEQANNKRSNHLITLGGVTDTLIGWARRLGLTTMGLRYRLARLPVEEALVAKKQGAQK